MDQNFNSSDMVSRLSMLCNAVHAHNFNSDLTQSVQKTFINPSISTAAKLAIALKQYDAPIKLLDMQIIAGLVLALLLDAV